MHIFTLLTAVLLALALGADPKCKEGIRTGSICCPKACGICGGPKCGTRSRMLKDLCCKAAIVSSKRNCLTSSAPCKITKAKPGKVGSKKPDPMCKTGLLRRKACCPAECSNCGGKDCFKRGNLIKSDCCVVRILKKADSCSDRGPPCVVNEPEMSEEPTATVEETVEPLPAMCKKLKRSTGGCFCYLTIVKKMLPKMRKKVIAMCTEIFGSRKAMKLFEPKCKKFMVGKKALVKQDNLVKRINALIPLCFPEGTPLIMLKPRKATRLETWEN